MRARRRPAFLVPGEPPEFPDPRAYDGEGLVAVGGDLSEARLLHAYDNGIFPWYDDNAPLLWWSPDPRAIVEEVHVSRSLARRLRKRDLETTHDRAFERVMRECGVRDGGTWITTDMLDAYADLHRRGHAHSVEVWREGVLVGGIYGVQRGALFAAESMFHRETDASKVALVTMHRAYFAAGIELFDVQFLTLHLESMGAREISRADYLERVARARGKSVTLPGR